MLGNPDSVFTEKTFVEIGSVYIVEQWLSCLRLQETCWSPGMYRLRTFNFFQIPFESTCDTHGMA